jgi:hypothetical protein
MLLPIIFHVYFGLPLIAWGGIATSISLLSTATFGYTMYIGINHLPIKWHFRLAALTIVLGLIHGLVAFLAFLGV